MGEKDRGDPVLLIKAYPAPEALIIKLISKGMNIALTLCELSFPLSNAVIDILLRCISV